MKFCIVVMALKVTSIISKWLSVCPSLITLNPLVHFHEICLGRNDIQGDLNAIIFNAIASIILYLFMFNAVR
jgi:hypothetical protein